MRIEEQFKAPRRYADWPQRLEAALAEWSHKSFRWGETDCFCFAAAMIEAMTGYNPMDGMRGTYHDEVAAYSILNDEVYLPDADRTVPVGGHFGAVSMALGEEQPAGMAQRGDLMLFHVKPDAKLIGVVDGTGRQSAAMAEGRGMVRLPNKWGRASWRV